MQPFSFENSNFQMRFPKSLSKSQLKSQNIKENNEIKKPPQDLSFSKVPRQVLSEITQENLKETNVQSNQSNDNFLEKFEEKSKSLLVENEKYRKKIEFLTNILENTLKFDETRNVLELKTFVRMNYKRFHGILDEIYTFKEEIEKTKEL